MDSVRGIAPSSALRRRHTPPPMTANDDHTTECTELEPGDVLYDGETGEEYAVIVDIDDAGVTMRHGDTESFVPHALFAPWNDDGLILRCGDTRSEISEREWSDMDIYEQVC